MDTVQNKITILMFPWLAHGHITPFLELSKKLANRNFYIYFCSTPINLNSIKSKISQKYINSIQFVELNLPSLPNLPPHYHTTNGLPPHLMRTLKNAFDSSSEPFFEILKTLNPNLLVYDFLQTWAPTLASSLNIPAVEFISTSAVMCSFGRHVTENPSVDFPFGEIYLHDYEVPGFERMREDDGIVQECCDKSLKIVLIKTLKEIEDKYIDYFSLLTNKKIVPVGPLIQNPNFDDEHDAKIIEWLDKREISSTIFVSFGSEYFCSEEEIIEIALGLEMSKVNFIWIIRFHLAERELKMNLQESLPKGFLERTKERGIVVENWASQPKILRHGSIGGFLTHCGWSSVIESLMFGVPIIAMPMHLDQPFNARLVDDIGVGIEIRRDEKGRLRKEEVARSIREVVVEGKGECVRHKVKEFSENVMKCKGEEEIDNVANELVKICCESIG
ncbi:hypothetical protein ACFE04_002655 [Oxalis oulophora]